MGVVGCQCMVRDLHSKPDSVMYGCVQVEKGVRFQAGKLSTNMQIIGNPGGTTNEKRIKDPQKNT